MYGEHIDDIKEREIADKEATEAYIDQLEKDNKALRELLGKIAETNVLDAGTQYKIKEALNS